MLLLIPYFIFQLLIALTAPHIGPKFEPQFGVHGLSFMVGNIQDIWVRANFDGLHYLLIAERGYQEYERIFFPLYPTLIALGGKLTGGNLIIAGLLISCLTFILGFWVFGKLLRKTYPEIDYRWALLALIAYPAAFFFTTVYTESLFFLLLVSTICLSVLNKKIWATVTGFLASLTRLAGVFTGIFLGFPYLLGPIIGLGLYMGYQWQTGGSPTLFMSEQVAFKNARSTDHLIFLPQVLFRYAKILLTPFFKQDFAIFFDHNYFVATCEFTLFILVFGILIWELWNNWRKIQNTKSETRRKSDDPGNNPTTRRESVTPATESESPQRMSSATKTPTRNPKLETLFSLLRDTQTQITLFSLINIILPTLTGTLSSVPRYSLMSIALYPAIARMPKVAKIPVIFFFALLQVAIAVRFLQGWFVS